MKTFKVGLLALATSVAALAATPASATSSSNVSVSNFSYTLFDLNSLDGVTASITFSDSNFLASMGANPVLSLAGTSASSLSLNGRYDENSGFFSGFTLSANSAVLFSMDAQAASSASASAGGLGFPGLFMPSFATAHVQLYGALGSQNSYSQISAVADPMMGQENQANSDKLEISFLNLSGVTKEGLITVSANINGQGAVAAVPEPESWAMLLSGLAVVASVVRRRRKFN